MDSNGLKGFLIPEAVIPATVESLRYYRTSRSRIIYTAVILSLVLVVALLPFISVDVSVRSSAFIRPASEISSIKSLVNGRIKDLWVSENKHVRKGDVLYVIESDVLDEKEKYLYNKTNAWGDFVDDLRVLITNTEAGTVVKPEDLKTPFYRQSSSNYQQRLDESLTHYSKTTKDYERNKKLHDENVIADAEFESYVFEYNKAGHQLEITKQTQLSQWQTELAGYKKELQEYESQYAQFIEEKENLMIKAPVSGTIQIQAGVYPGSIVFSNQELAQISPDTSFVVEAYVLPADIGLLNNHMLVRFQVDAFNYNQWGFASGRITELPNDIQIINERPVFKVKCSLDRDHLHLKNGYKGYLKKGMTLQAHFIVTERTLWQLLFDEVDDWMNPNTYKKISDK
ncbi:HlyD family secretion protein [Ohtaekwangia sp.]|uniref:HlyD family secretion protein n=1 Tax=Ohtaekwangia sp. TaxID=2066019 RepID=UPI002FDCDB06